MRCLEAVPSRLVSHLKPPPLRRWLRKQGWKSPPAALSPVGVRQIAATLAAHKAHVYAVALTPLEMRALKWEAGVAHGNEEDTERTYVEVTTLSAMLDSDTVDWSNVGMIFQTLFKG